MPIRIIINKFKYIKDNWKMIIHLLFTTYRFGVNNMWWSQFDSMFGKPIRKRFNPFTIYRNYKFMKIRAITCYFIQDPYSLFPEKKKRRKKHENKN